VNLKKRDVRDFLTSIPSDIDAAIDIFSDHFKAWRNIKFEFQGGLEINDILELQLSDVLGSLHALGWKCTYNKKEISDEKKICYSGFIHGKKEIKNKKPLEYGVAGFIYYEKEMKIIVDGTLYGQDKELLDGVYQRILEIANGGLKYVTELEPRKNFPWQIYDMPA
jgi:hypothetical protein